MLKCFAPLARYFIYLFIYWSDNIFNFLLLFFNWTFVRFYFHFEKHFRSLYRFDFNTFIYLKGGTIIDFTWGNLKILHGWYEINKEEELWCLLKKKTFIDLFFNKIKSLYLNFSIMSAKLSLTIFMTFDIALKLH